MKRTDASRWISALITSCIVGSASTSARAAQGVAVADQPVSASSARITVQPPAGWIYRTSGSDVAATRDGFLLNNVTFSLRKHKKAFPSLKKPSTADALPEELAENYVADLKLQPGINDVTLIAVEPAELAGQQAFKVRLTYRIAPEQGGATYEEQTLGAPTADGLLLARYTAPQINFFAKSLPAYEDMVRSLSLAAPAAKR